MLIFGKGCSTPLTGFSLQHQPLSRIQFEVNKWWLFFFFEIKYFWTTCGDSCPFFKNNPFFRISVAMHGSVHTVYCSVPSPLPGSFTPQLTEWETQFFNGRRTVPLIWCHDEITLAFPLLRRIKKQSCFSSPPSSLLGAASHFFFFFFYKNADNALEIELKRSKIEMPLSSLKDFYTWNMFRHVFVQM